MDYTGAWWQVYLIVGGWVAVPLMIYYWEVDDKFKLAIEKGLRNPELSRTGKIFGGFFTFMTTYVLFMVIWPLLIALPIVEKLLERC